MYVFVLRKDHLEVIQVPHIKKCLAEILGPDCMQQPRCTVPTYTLLMHLTSSKLIATLSPSTATDTASESACC
jgi:hypothetical protein